jgi:hypothetical protein
VSHHRQRLLVTAVLVHLPLQRLRRMWPVRQLCPLEPRAVILAPVSSWMQQATEIISSLYTYLLLYLRVATELLLCDRDVGASGMCII